MIDETSDTPPSPRASTGQGEPSFSAAGFGDLWAGRSGTDRSIRRFSFRYGPR
jgi:hypothetical protein